MPKHKRLLPFSWMPASWGLKGKSRQLAEAEYYYTGVDLELEVSAIKHADDPYELERNKLRITHLSKNDCDHEQLERDLRDLELKHGYMTEKEHELALLEIDKSYNKVSQNDYLSKKASINKEPYVNVLSMDIDDELPTQGAFELDWNDEFIKMLHAAGITGTSDEDIVNKWFNSVCRTVLMQNAADQDYGLSQPSQPQGREDVLRKINPRTED